MIHLFKHSKKGKLCGKFDIALVIKGKVIFSTVQGYENHNDAYKAILSIGNHFSTREFNYQDDTGLAPVVNYVVKNTPLKNFIVSRTNLRPKKKYQP